MDAAHISAAYATLNFYLVHNNSSSTLLEDGATTSFVSFAQISATLVGGSIPQSSAAMVEEPRLVSDKILGFKSASLNLQPLIATPSSKP